MFASPFLVLPTNCFWLLHFKCYNFKVSNLLIFGYHIFTILSTYSSYFIFHYSSLHNSTLKFITILLNSPNSFSLGTMIQRLVPRVTQRVTQRLLKMLDTSHQKSCSWQIYLKVIFLTVCSLNIILVEGLNFMSVISSGDLISVMSCEVQAKCLFT